jgi:hypothetical protein
MSPFMALLQASNVSARYRFFIRLLYNIQMTNQIIETTADQVSAELKRRGISSDERVTVTIEPDKELIPGRRESRARVAASGLTDADIDRLVKQAQQEVEPRSA